MLSFRGLVAAALLLGLFQVSVKAHEGHDHDAAVSALIVHGAPRAAAASELFELVAVAKDGELTVYLDRFATNEPVSGAAITVETPKGSVEAKPILDGTYRVPAPWANSPGQYNLIFTVTDDGSTDILPLTLQVLAAPSARVRTSGFSLTDTAMAHGLRETLSTGGSYILLAVIVAFLVGTAGGIFFAKRKKTAALLLAVGIVTLLAPRTFAHEGDDHDATAITQATVTREVAQLLSEGGVFVPKSTQRILAIRTVLSEQNVHNRVVELPGRIIPDPGASGYVQTTIGGRLSPPEGGFPRLGTPVKKGDILAYVTPPIQAIDVSDMRQRQGELDQQISIVERRLARYETLAPSGTVARSQLEDTRLELEGLKDRRASLDKARRDPEALVASAEGIIAEGTPIAGQVAQSNAVIFSIIDPSRLWIEALSYEALPNLARGTVRVREKELALAFRGSGFADRNQSIPIHFAIEGDVSSLRVGQFVTVLAETPDQQRGIAVPRNSVVRTSAGQDVVYEHVDAERFEQRPVRIEPLDGQRVLVSQGLEAGKRVVVQGSELIEQIR
jgi:uncharacterized membrane protein YjjB (DUF3815 family)